VTRYVWVNGAIVESSAAAIMASDRGFTLGDGVFETLTVSGGCPVRLADHLRRLRASAAALSIPVPYPDGGLEQAVLDTARANDLAGAVVRVTLTRGPALGRGLVPADGAAPTLVVQAHPWRKPATGQPHGIRVALASVRRNETSPASRIKAIGGYLDALVARAEAGSAGYDDAILLNTTSHVACATTSNLCAVLRGAVLTPALECGVLDGVTRRAVREIADALGIQWTETWLTAADVLSADEVFLTNSVRTVVPVVSVGGSQIAGGEVGPITLALRREYLRVL
jgi:branched-chain amino acid aminotransferase